MKIIVLGSGVVGRSTGVGLADKGHHVIFVDINQDVVRRLQAEGYDARLPGELGHPQVDIVMVCINTPSAVDGSVNLTYITEGMRTVGDILAYQEDWTVAVIRSSVPPTTTEQYFIPMIEMHSGLRAGTDFGVCMNPEFLRATSSVEDFAHPWATVIGQLDARSGDVLERLYRPFGGQLFRMTLAEAEFVKYANNLRNATIISFNNEMWKLGQSLGLADPNHALGVVTETAESAWNPKYGSKGGFPYGGTCLPKDTVGLLSFAQATGHEMPLLAGVIAVNEQMNELADRGEVPGAQVGGHNWRPSPVLALGNGNGKTGNGAKEASKSWHEAVMTRGNGNGKNGDGVSLLSGNGRGSGQPPL
jgi:UDPglucose 6-dehydrogenase